MAMIPVKAFMIRGGCWCFDNNFNDWIISDTGRYQSNDRRDVKEWEYLMDCFGEGMLREIEQVVVHIVFLWEIQPQEKE